MLRPDRPALVVTSTSWTADEDFDMLIEGLGMYERAAREVNSRGEERGTGMLPKVVMLVTGRGENRDKYMERVIRLEVEEGWEWVRCRSVWLSSNAYPILLGELMCPVCYRLPAHFGFRLLCCAVQALRISEFRCIAVRRVWTCP